MTVQDAEAVVAEVIEDARAPLPARDRPLTVPELVGLWHGDDYVMGFWSPALVFAVLDRRRPAEFRLLREAFYPGVLEGDVPAVALDLLSKCYQVWERAREKRAA